MGEAQVPARPQRGTIAAIVNACSGAGATSPACAPMSGGAIRDFPD